MNRPDKRKLLAIAERALAQTQANRLRWDVTDLHGRFTSPLANGSLAIEQSDEEVYWFAVLNDQGSRLEEASVRTDPLFYLTSDAPAGMGELASVLPELYDQARRKALNVDQAIESILEELA